MTRLAIGLVWLLRLLPFPLLVAVGRGLGLLLYAAARERREVVLTNLRLCFPERSEGERRALARAHFQALGRAILEQGIGWWSSQARIRRIVRVRDEHYLAGAAQGQGQVIVLALHFVGVDMGAIRMSGEYSMATLYSTQKNAVLDALLRKARTRFGRNRLLSRLDGIRPVVRAMREGWSLFYLPDMDFGPGDSIFVPFFGVQAATIPGLSRLAKLTGARVVPFVTRQLPGAQGYEVRFYPPWDDFPTHDVVADTRRMNAFIEARVRETPEQYYWVHKRFKTRPPGEARFY
ncbi:MAG TPA: lipid A biosynthesis acyltransferase [Burkholderiales bacterium]|nr:lipid A biosynthesis acyltransferase [Burkholderiales bacterium]